MVKTTIFAKEALQYPSAWVLRLQGREGIRSPEALGPIFCQSLLVIPLMIVGLVLQLGPSARSHCWEHYWKSWGGGVFVWFWGFFLHAWDNQKYFKIFPKTVEYCI